MAKKTDAIQEDGSKVVTGDEVVVGDEVVIEPILSERDLDMAAINEELGKESSDEEVVVVVAPVVAEEEKKPLSDTELAPETLVKVKLDGEEKMLPLSEVTTGFQKASVGSARLSDAAERSTALDLREKGIVQREQALATDTQLSPVVEIDNVDIDDQIADLTDALVEGDNDKVQKTLKEVLVPQQPVQQVEQVDVEAIATTVQNRVEHSQEVKDAQADDTLAWDEFTEASPDFADAESPARKYGDYIFDTVYAPQMKAGEISYREALVKTAEDVLKVHPAETVVDPVVDPGTARTERKGKIKNLPTAGARAVKAKEIEQSSDDVVAEMATGRGQ